MSMPDATSRFETTSPNIVTEQFDDEMVVVDFDTGRYFSLDVVGAEIFTLLVAHHTVAEITALLAQHFSDTPEHIGAVVAGFATELLDAQLLIPNASAGAGDAPSAPFTFPGGTMPVPALTGYTDMQDLLMLDPIHDVADTGWPARPDAQS